MAATISLSAERRQSGLLLSLLYLHTDSFLKSSKDFIN
ncbi:hypothetical protein J2783_001784 [Chryseobacterium sediminis]|nr:hypothetical protein [Chryseobacterium sediminis]